MRIIKWYEQVENVAICIALLGMVVMMLLTTIDVTARYLRGAVVPNTYCLIELILATGALSLAYLERIRGHIAVEFITERLPASLTSKLDLTSLILIFLFSCVVSWSTWIAAVNSWQTGDYAAGLINWPTAPFRFALAIGFVLLSIRTFIQITEHFMPQKQEQA